MNVFWLRAIVVLLSSFTEMFFIELWIYLVYNRMEEWEKKLFLNWLSFFWWLLLLINIPIGIMVMSVWCSILGVEK